MKIKEIVKIVLLALPFAWLASVSLPFFNQLGFGFWLVESFSITGYWPVNIAFYGENLLSALLTVTPYVVLIVLLVPSNKYITIVAAILAYALFTFLLCFQKEHLTACLFTLVQSAHVAVYLAIVIIFEVLTTFFCKLGTAAK